MYVAQVRRAQVRTETARARAEKTLYSEMYNFFVQQKQQNLAPHICAAAHKPQNGECVGHKFIDGFVASIV